MPDYGVEDFHWGTVATYSANLDLSVLAGTGGKRWDNQVYFYGAHA